MIEHPLLHITVSTENTPSHKEPSNLSKEPFTLSKRALQIIKRALKVIKRALQVTKRALHSAIRAPYSGVRARNPSPHMIRHSLSMTVSTENTSLQKSAKSENSNSSVQIQITSDFPSEFVPREIGCLSFEFGWILTA